MDSLHLELASPVQSEQQENWVLGKSLSLPFLRNPGSVMNLLEELGLVFSSQGARTGHMHADAVISSFEPHGIF